MDFSHSTIFWTTQISSGLLLPQDTQELPVFLIVLPALIEAYEARCEKTGISPLTKMGLCKEMEKLGYERTRIGHSGDKGFEGISLKSQQNLADRKLEEPSGTEQYTGTPADRKFLKGGQQEKPSTPELPLFSFSHGQVRIIQCPACENTGIYPYGAIWKCSCGKYLNEKLAR